MRKYKVKWIGQGIVDPYLIVKPANPRTICEWTEDIDKATELTRREIYTIYHNEELREKIALIPVLENLECVNNKRNIDITQIERLER
jgi:hypothetical protein